MQKRKKSGTDTKQAEIEVTFGIDHEGLRDIERLKALLGSPNLATALYNAVFLINTLYEYQNQGYELRVVKNDDVRSFRLP